MIRALCWAANVIAAVFLAAVATLVVLESTWSSKELSSARDYFLYGSTGTELMPLAVFSVLPDLFPDQFQPAGKKAGDWIEQFGFVRGGPGVDGLPAGINVSRYRPGSGAPSPVEFVGFNCAICHVGQIRRSDSDSGVTIVGMANQRIDLVAFGDAIKTSLLDEKRLTPASISSAYEAKYGRPLSLSDKITIELWLQAARKQLRASLPLRGPPFGGMDLRNASLLPSGPGRNQPMRETVRFLMNVTPLPDGGASKIPCLYEESRREWAQYDGSVRDPVTRNSLAALGVGATIYNLRVGGILNTLRYSYQYISSLAGPRYSEVFAGSAPPIDAARAQRGRAVYAEYCIACHGAPGSAPGTWVRGSRQGQVIPQTEVGTDPARVTFRFYPELADAIYNFFPPGHPLRPLRQNLRPNPGDPHGFIAAPIESAFSRAPYLHNGSVPTLAELINLQPRPVRFYRGANVYDVRNLGLIVPAHPDARRYFQYDTTVYGNSNRGHDYPWSYKGRGWNPGALTDLLEYLKTI